MKIPLEYNARSLLQRPVSTLLTALGIALVVAVFIGMLALANGFRAALVQHRLGSERDDPAPGRRLRAVQRHRPPGRQHPGVLASRRDRGRTAGRW